MTTAVAYAAAPAAATPCPPQPAASARPRAGGGGVRFNRPRRRSEQTVWIPEALFVGVHFNDEAVSVYTKVAALDARRSFPGGRQDTDPCTAHTAELADMLGMSVSGVQRGLKLLNRPGPGGEEPWLRTKQRTHTGGKGRTALRYARLVPRSEAALEIPVQVAEALSPRRLRAYLHLARATAKGLPVTGAELAGELFHHSGKSAGKPLGQKTGYRLLDELEDLGWLTLGRRAGERARHAVTVNTRPLHTATDEPVQLALPVIAQQVPTDNDDGVGAVDHDGSLASKEDTSLSTDVVGQAGSGIRRRRTTGSYQPRPVDNAAGPTFRGAAQDEKRSNTSGGTTYTGPGLQLSPRVWRVLEPVRHHLPEISTYVMRRIGQEIGRQLCAGTGEERLTDRLRLRYSNTEAPRGGDVGRWILGAALVRHGCYLDTCESGFTWHTGAPCPVCTVDQLAADDATGPDGAQQQRPVSEERPVRVVVTDWVPRPAPAPDVSPPSELTRKQLQELRAAATPDAIRRAVAEHGRTRATYLYGHALVLPHLAEIDPGGDTAHAPAQ
ncbi:hypothetical protein [Streptomyces sp. NPDC057428]|uniref:hypothetical protein n=1 Tax=Streptomyces sp. NPDC057428 TaxID=3346129 RepID=UPI0036A9EDBF